MRTDPPEVETNRRYTITQTAELLGVSTRTVQRYILAGTIQAQIRKSNSKRFIEGSEITKTWYNTI